VLGELEDNALIKRLKRMVIKDTEINGTHFSKQVKFMTLSLLRAFI